VARMSTGFARTDDGIQLYYRVVGTGPTLVCCNGIGVSTFFWRHIIEHFGERFRTVQWDYRGHGRSTPPADTLSADLSMERNARDLATVLDTIGIDEPVILLGHSMGCQVVLEFHHLYPHRVRALVPMLGTYARALDTFFDSKHSKRLIDLVTDLASKSTRASQRLLLPLYASPVAFAFARYTGLVDKHYATERDIGRYTEHLLQVDPNLFLRMAQQMGTHDLTEHLPHIDVPTLVVGAENDLFTPLHRSEKMRDLIPNAELFVLPDASHAALVEQPEIVNTRLERFFRERLPDLERPPRA
jgi:pimeloyl-ACP methyl ester carboxylesterase